MTKYKPTIINQYVNDNNVILTLNIDADIIYFKGHFTSYPLLPGVTQIDWAIFYGQLLLDTERQFAGMEVIKFQEPILPDTTVELSLTWLADKEKLSFIYTSFREGQNEPIIHSSGRIKLEMAP